MNYEEALDEIERFLGVGERITEAERKRARRKRGDDPENVGRLLYVEFEQGKMPPEDCRKAMLTVCDIVQDATVAHEVLDVLGLLDD